MSTERIYHYRGMIERGPNYAWREGYSMDGKNGGILYPWATMRECQSEAKSLKAKAVFYRDGKRAESSRPAKRGRVPHKFTMTAFGWREK